MNHGFILIATLAATLAAQVGDRISEPTKNRSRTLLVHHGMALPESGTPARELTASKLIELADNSCFLFGNSVEGLRQWAETAHGTASNAQDLAKHDNDYTQLVGGWTLTTEIGAVAVIQSAMRPPASGHVCSITAKLTADEQHAQTKAEFQRRFESVIEEEKDASDQHIDRFWIERSTRPPVKASIVFTKSNRIITIRMIHGKARPLRS